MLLLHFILSLFSLPSLILALGYLFSLGFQIISQLSFLLLCFLFSLQLQYISYCLNPRDPSFPHSRWGGAALWEGLRGWGRVMWCALAIRVCWRLISSCGMLPRDLCSTRNRMTSRRSGLWVCCLLSLSVNDVMLPSIRYGGACSGEDSPELVRMGITTPRCCIHLLSLLSSLASSAHCGFLRSDI